MRSRGHRAALLLLVLPVTLTAQVGGGRSRPSQTPVARDSMPRRNALAPGVRSPSDSARRDTVASWLPADETMQALLRKPGYGVTRYEGDVVTFDAATSAFAVAAAASQRAQVEREGQRVDTDSLIVYRDRHVDVSGRFRMIAGGGQPPVAGTGSASYDMAARSGRLTNAELTVDESGARWFIKSDIGKTALGDSARQIPTRFYGVGGTLTSCEDSIPDYHFRMREIKRTDRTLVARPAVMYIRDIPVMWLPFVFQDIRSGRRSGVLPPRFGLSDIVRNNPNYRRHVENVGYYWAMNDYMDATTWLDWRSASGGDPIDPGWYKLNFEWQYSWLTRFLQGRLGSSYQRTGSDRENFAVSWGHRQRLGQRNLTTDVNYVTSTQLQRQNSFNTYQAMSTIRSSFNYSDKLGPASLQLGGGRTQYPGRDQVDQDLPKLSITSAPLALFSWLVWTPGFSYQETSRLHMDTPWQFTQRFARDSSGRLIADSLDRNETDRRISFDTPLRIFGYEFRSGVRIHDWLKDYPEERDVYLGADSGRKESRVFPRTFGSEVDWSPTIALPAIFQNRLKLSPSVSLNNVDPRPFWVRSYLTGGAFVHQSKRLVYSVSAAPTIFGILPGIGPFQRFRHSISPTVSYSIAPKAKISDDYLAAIGEIRQRYVGTLPQSAVSFGLSQNVEAKVRVPLDTGAGGPGGQKLKLLSMQFSPITYDFERAKDAGRKLAGLTTESFGSRLTSDLFPGMDFSLDYSLFRGSTMTDTATFEPFLTRVASTVRFSDRENPFTVVARLFGGADQPGARSRDDPQTSPDATFAGHATQPVAGQGARNAQFVVPPVEGWQANVSFSLSRSRPPRSGDDVINFDPKVRCEPFRLIDPFEYDRCLRIPSYDLPTTSLIGGGPQVIGPPQISMSGDLRFRLTQKWSATWNTSFDFVQRQFASQVVTLQRDLHDWRSIFAFTRSSNGNFAFTFNIALKPQPDLKFDYSRASVRSR